MKAIRFPLSRLARLAPVVDSLACTVTAAFTSSAFGDYAPEPLGGTVYRESTVNPGVRSASDPGDCTLGCAPLAGDAGGEVLIEVYFLP